MPREITDAQLLTYAENHTSRESEALAAISRDTHANVLMPRMLSGHLQGRLLAMFSHMIRPQFVLEIGTYTGYSAICLSEGLREGGQVITIDKNDELQERVLKNVAAAGVQSKVRLVTGDAAEIIPTLDYCFDLVFIDADKINYESYYDLVWPKVRSGGFILADNVLWSGKVIDQKQDKDTRALVEFNRRIQEDTRTENVLLPVRDGIMLVRKVSL
jgi:predicted O-methyltransferase YrrM